MGPGRDGWKGCHGEKEKGSGYNTPYPTQGPPHRPSRMYDREREEEEGRMESRARARREERAPRYTTQLVSSVFPSFGSQYSNSPLPPSPALSESTERVCSLSSSLSLPAARYRLPNNLTDCSAPATSAIRVLVSFQNLSEYPAILTSVKRRGGRFVENCTCV